MDSTYCIAITYRDDENNRLIELGGAAWETQQEWDNAWDNIPVARDDLACCIADKIDGNDDIVEDRIVDRETVETLLGKPISQLIEDATEAIES